MSARGCKHFEVFIRDPVNVDTIKWIHSAFVVCSNYKYKLAKISNCYCRVCNNRGPYLQACLECVYFGCHKHIKKHFSEEVHNFAMELVYGNLFCANCNDYIYDANVDDIYFKNKMHSMKFNKKLFDYLSWNPSDEERLLLFNRTKKICITADSRTGLRGLINLGSTCFMNCIVQTLIHTPLLRDHFLTAEHVCKGSLATCLVCEISNLFQEFYNGNDMPLALTGLLHLIWRQAPHLGSEDQQDAHEFFIETLNILHKHFLENFSYQNHHPATSVNCTCIVHQIFTGGLQSDVVCQKCNGISTTIDPSWDFSLDLGPVTADGRPPSTLLDCLERFTKAEHLGSNSKIMCEICGSKQESTKQFTISTLPVVISFHLKRFKHIREAKTKISSCISFPETLDMTPYLSKNKKNLPFSSDNRYSLFAVVSHIGKSLDSGHYIAYVRQQNDYWYECDDDVITRANLREVLQSEGYILFYHKHVLNYE